VSCSFGASFTAAAQAALEEIQEMKLIADNNRKAGLISRYDLSRHVSVLRIM
jgi:hypothetical protein